MSKHCKHIKNETQIHRFGGKKVPFQTIEYIDKEGFFVRKTIQHKNWK